MGTNFYWYENKDSEPKHIGKSSAGWYFSLRIYPDENILNLLDWATLWKIQSSRIEDEYGRRVPPADIYDNILNRHRHDPPDWDEKMFKENNAELGSNNLVRSLLSDRCAGHAPNGEPYSFFIGEFS